MTHRRFLLFVCIAIGILLSGINGRAQLVKGAINGVVTDPSGAVIPHVSVTATEINTGYLQKTTTNNSGVYLFPVLNPGDYRVKASAPGFQTTLQDKTQLQVGATVTINFKLQVGAQQNEISVNASSTAELDTATPELDTTLSKVQVQELPVQDRDIMALVRVLPGIVPTTPSTVIGATGNRNYFDNGFAINGSRTSSNEVLLDGVPDTIGDFNAIAVIPPIGSVSEFKLVSGVASPQYGRTSGGVISITTLGGSNKYHGSLDLYLQNSVFNANGWQNNRNHIKRASSDRAQFGGSLSGPLTIPHIYNGHDRTFFFADYEGRRERNPFAPAPYTVPTDEEKMGNFANAGYTIYDPATTQCATPACTSYTRTAFLGNMIPMTREDPVAKALLAYYPEPNLPGVTNNYAFGGTSPLHKNLYDIRIDENLSSRHNLFTRYTAQQNANTTPDYFGTGASSGRTIFDTFHNLVFGDDFTIKSSLVNDFRFGYARARANQIPTNSGFDPQKLGFPGYITQFASVLEFPNVSLGGNTPIAALGAQGYNNQPRDTISVSEGVIYTKGNHNMRFGTDLRLYRFYPFQTINPTGAYSFSDTFTRANPLASDTKSGQALAALFLGALDPGSFDEYVTRLTIFHSYYAFYGQDIWKASPRLTLNFGLRWERETGTAESHDRLTYFDPNAPSPIAGQVPGLNFQGTLKFTGSGNPRTATDTPYNAYSPRVGLIYALDDKTVVRTGYGIFYLPIALEALSAQGFNVQDNIPQNGTIFSTVSLQNPFPTGLVRPTGRDAGESVDLGQSIAAVYQHLGNDYAYNQLWDLSIQHIFGKNLLFEVAYVGSRGVHLPLNALSESQLPDSYLSQGPLLAKSVPNPFYGIFTTGSLSGKTVQQGQLYAPYPQYSSVTLERPNFGDSSYQSLQYKVSKQYSDGLSLQMSYNWSKTIDTGGVGNGSAFTDATAVQDVYNLRAERSLSDQDVPNAFLLSGVYDLPYGHKRRFGSESNRYLNAVAGGWQVTGLWIWQSGRPLALSAANSNPGFNNPRERPNVVPGVIPYYSLSDARANVRNGKPWFNPAAFTQPAAYTYGNTGRNISSVRTDTYKDVDFSLHKNFAVTDRINVQFRAEAFNVFETTVFATPVTSQQSSTFGGVFGIANKPRVMQFAFRGTF